MQDLNNDTFQEELKDPEFVGSLRPTKDSEIMKEDQINYLNPGRTNFIDHPNQSIYDNSIDKDFRNSIEMFGVIQPIVITDAQLYGQQGYMIVSGHRRYKVAKETRIDKVPFIFKKYINKEDCEREHLLYNKQRVKTNAEKAAEIEAWKQKLSHIRNILMTKGVKGLHGIISNSMQQLLQADPDGNPYLSTKDVIESQTGISRRTQDALNVIFSEDWLEDKCEKIWSSPFPEKKRRKTIDDFTNLVNEARTAVDDADQEEITVNKAFNEIKRVWRDIEIQIHPDKIKRQKVKQVKKSNVIAHEPKEDNPNFYQAHFSKTHPAFYVRGKILTLGGDDFDDCAGIMLDFGKNGKIFFDLVDFLKKHNLKYEKE